MNNKSSFVKAVLGAAALIAAFAAQAAPAPACSASVANPSWSDCAAAFPGNDTNPRANGLATILVEFGPLDFNDAPSSSLDFSSSSVNAHATGRGLAHASLYATQAVPAIPEPHTNTLLLAGLAAIGIMALRRRLYT